MSNPDHGEIGPQGSNIIDAADIYRNLGDQAKPDAAERLSAPCPVTEKRNMRLDAGDSIVADARAFSVIPDEIMREQGIQGKAIGILTMDSAEGQEGSPTSFAIIEARSAPNQYGASPDGGGQRGVFDGDKPIDTGNFGFRLVEVKTQSAEEGQTERSTFISQLLPKGLSQGPPCTVTQK